LSIRAFDVQSGWRDAYERQREYMRRDLFMGKLNPEKFSQRLQDLNRYLDLISIEKTSDSLKVTKAYERSLPEDEIRSIMGRAIPPEWTVNLLALGKEPWRFKDLEDQLNMYRQQWQADQQKQIIAQMAGKHPTKLNDGNRKIVIGIIKIPMADAVVIAMETLLAEEAEDVEEAAVVAVVAVGEEKIVSIYRMSNVSIVARKATIPLNVPS
jgi:hypothetical protein